MSLHLVTGVTLQVLFVGISTVVQVVAEEMVQAAVQVAEALEILAVPMVKTLTSARQLMMTQTVY
ncbi:hypothetical protein [Idiomarina abyssalis]|uniref:hypothetical protein n=1 Tax=Idiomarina abyssalis TaxID=86102 RepID=UPI00241C52C5|nr:hypothetical protein [Idiomarina abyssalis]|tara:strand:- start:30469 stop:30663 length:195 start_codon:yes stop_codon:yes gene_type:complete